MPSGFYVLGHCIAHSKCFWRIDLQLTDGDWLDAMLKGLNTKEMSGFIKDFLLWAYASIIEIAFVTFNWSSALSYSIDRIWFKVLEF